MQCHVSRVEHLNSQCCLLPGYVNLFLSGSLLTQALPSAHELMRGMNKMQYSDVMSGS